MKYRQLFEHTDTLRRGDQFAGSNADINDPDPNGLKWFNMGDPYSMRFAGNNIYRRPIPHNWISFKDRKPTKEDAYSGPADSREHDENHIIVRHIGGVVRFRSVDYTLSNLDYFTHWMPLNFVEDKPAPIQVDGKSIIPQADGSVKLSCGSTILRKDVEEFIKQYTSVTKGTK
jgi:hypothetical protein